MTTCDKPASFHKKWAGQVMVYTESNNSVF